MALTSACNSGPSQVVIPPVEALVASGDSQYGTTGQTLTAPLQVHVRGISTGLPRSGVTIVWTVEAGDAPLTPDLPAAPPKDVAGALISGGAAAARLVAAIARG